MEIDNNSQLEKSFGIPNLFIYLGIILIIVISVALFIGYVLGQKSNSKQSVPNENIVSSNYQEEKVSPTPASFIIPVETSNIPSSQPVVNSKDTKACSKYGLAQKWEFLTTYTIKENDSLTNIAKEQLKDEARVNEILKINGVGPLVVGSTLYLPPPTISKSSGNLKQIYGKLVSKDTASWHILITTDPDGQSILVPTFLFNKISNKDSYNVGDCLKVFLDDGYEVYTVSKQS